MQGGRGGGRARQAAARAARGVCARRGWEGRAAATRAGRRTCGRAPRRAARRAGRAEGRARPPRGPEGELPASKLMASPIWATLAVAPRARPFEKALDFLTVTAGFLKRGRSCFPNSVHARRWLPCRLSNLAGASRNAWPGERTRPPKHIARLPPGQRAQRKARVRTPTSLIALHNRHRHCTARRR